MNKAVKKVMNTRPYTAEELHGLRPWTPKHVVLEQNEAIKNLNKKLGTRIAQWKPKLNVKLKQRLRPEERSAKLARSE